MSKTNISTEDYNALLDFINSEIKSRGLKATTMDSIASKYRISKRTLYEIFENKDQMIEAAVLHWREQASRKYSEIFASSSNIMEAILRCFIFNRDIIGKTSVSFLHDFRSFSMKKGPKSACSDRGHLENFIKILQKGVDEGYFRNDINLQLQCQLFHLQMESLRHMDVVFPGDMSIVEVFDAIIITFLRGISTPKGIDTLDKILMDL